MPFLRFSDDHHVGAIAFGRSRVHVQSLVSLWGSSSFNSAFHICLRSPYRVIDVVESEVSVGSGQVTDFLVDRMQLVALILRSPRARICGAAQGRLQLRCIQEFLVERGQEGFQTRERGGHETVVQHRLGGDDDGHPVVSRVRVGEDVFEIDDSKRSRDDDSEMVLASGTHPV